MTKELAHTPRPWFTGEPVGMQKPRIYGGTRPKLIAEVGNAETGPEAWEEHEANARLMAASLEMLEALKNAEAVMTIVEPRSNKATYLECLSMLRKAISKAEAGQ